METVQTKPIKKNYNPWCYFFHVFPSDNHINDPESDVVYVEKALMAPPDLYAS